MQIADADGVRRTVACIFQKLEYSSCICDVACYFGKCDPSEIVIPNKSHRGRGGQWSFVAIA